MLKVGEKVYYVNSGRQIDEYIVNRELSDDKVELKWVGDLHIVVTVHRDISKLPQIFDNKEDAIRRKEEMDAEYKMEEYSRINDILSLALAYVNLVDVEKEGVVLGRKVVEFHTLAEDGVTPVSGYHEAVLYNYKDIHYIAVYRKIEDEPVRCILFQRS